MRKKTICLDFDGVVHSYVSGWTGRNKLPTDAPVAGTRWAIIELRKTYRVIIYSSRCRYKYGIANILEWLKKYDIEVDDVVKTKHPAIVYVDDRGITFNGSWEKCLDDIKSFKTWLQKEKDNATV